MTIENNMIETDSKEYKEAAWFINRLIDLNTLSYEEIVRICKVAVMLTDKLEVTKVETIHKLKETW